LVVHPGGIISGHDYGDPTWPGVKRAVDQCFPAESVGHAKSIWWVRV
jgi:hypothetical protein